MSVGEDQQSNARRGRVRWAFNVDQLDRRHTFVLGVIAGALVLQVGSWIRGSGERPGDDAVTAVHARASRIPRDEAPLMRADEASAGARTERLPKAAPEVAADGAAPTTAAKTASGEDKVPKTESAAVAPSAAEALPKHHDLVLTSRAAPEGLVYSVPVPDVVHREGALKRNEFLATILTKAGATLVAQDELIRAFRGKYDFRLARPGHRYLVDVDHLGNVVGFEFRAGVDEVYRARRDDNGQLKAERVDVPVTREVVEVTGEIEKSLWEAFVDSGESEALAMELAEAFRFDIDFFHDTRKGDKFKLFVEKFTNDEGELVRYGQVYAAEYIGAPYSPVGTKRLFWFNGRKSKGYFDEKGKAAQRAFLRSPLKFTRVSSPFGYRRHPILGRRHFHGGVDYAAPTGTPVRAVAAGRVTFARRKGPNGLFVRIKHAGGYESMYLHLSRILVRNGQRVGQSTIIGKVGSTGRSTGPHLDFRLKKNGRYINPRRHVAPRTISVARAERSKYFDTIKPWLEKLDS